ncbi:PilZ domain-containing protein [Sphingomonas parva]|uniref:PilZ domain-containing protein n=1 Tax=Sphingomonas parva TaxID=2555898 RepID=A0A4Y8ZUB6_9SPHN|nr:PilZ domain-containing protein [Sphingomonas parva]TFI59601.1 PilZ domain-containing protein [Sphingomonas parva]
MLNLTPPADEPSDDRRQHARREARVATVMLVARLISARGDQLCRVRNLSTNGLKVNTPFPLVVGEEIRIELRNGRSVEGTIVWSSPPFAGMQFHKLENVEDLLSTTPIGGEAQVARLPRVQVNQPVLVHAGTRMLGASMIDLSQGGAKLRVRSSVEPGSMVSLSVTGLGSLKAVVRWSRDEEIGVAFHETIPFDTLSQWLTSRESQ